MSNRYSTDKGMQKLFEGFKKGLKEASIRDIPEDDGLGALKELVADMANGKIPIASAENIITAFQLYFEKSYLQAAGELRK